MKTALLALAVVSFAATSSADEPKKPKAAAKPGAAPAAASVSVKATAPTATVQVGPQLAPAGGASFLPADPATAPAPAQPPADRPGVSLAGFVGFATDGYGVGLGARAGYTFAFHLYLGGAFTYYAGDDLQHAWLVAPEVGYAWALPGGLPFLLRPYVGAGYAHLFALGVNGSALVAYPGVEFVYDILPNLFAGLDIQVPFLTQGNSAALFDGFATVGVKF